MKKWIIGSMLLLLQMQVLVPWLEGLFDTLDMLCVKQSNRMPLDVHSWNWVQNHQIQSYTHLDYILVGIFYHGHSFASMVKYSLD